MHASQKYISRFTPPTLDSEGHRLSRILRKFEIQEEISEDNVELYIYQILPSIDKLRYCIELLKG